MCTSLPWLLDLATLCKVNILTFEYTGYGHFKDRSASRDRIYDDAFSVAVSYAKGEFIELHYLIW